MTIAGRKPLEIAIWLAVLIFLGWILPSIIGIVYTDPLLHLAYAGLTVLFAAPVVVDRVYVDERGTWQHVLIGVRFAMLSFLFLIILDAVRVNRASGGNLWPNAEHIGRTTLIALGFAVFGAGLSAALAARVTRARTARQMLRTGFLLALAGTVFGLRHGGADLQFRLISMLQPGGAWGLLAVLFAVLILAGLGLARTAVRPGA